MTHRPTNLKRYDSGCAAQYSLSRDNPNFSSEPMERGTLVHLCAEKYLKAMVEGKAPEECDAVAREAHRDSGFPPEVVEDAVPFLDAFLSTPLPELNDSWLVEWEFFMDREWNLTTAADPYFGGRMDFGRVEDGVGYIRDWKNYWQILPESDLASDIQTHSYAYALWKKVPGLRGVVVERHFLLQRVLQKFTLTPDMLKGVPALLDRVINRIENDKVFAARPTEQRCSNCLVAPLCKTYRESGRLDMEPKSPEEWAALAREQEAIKAKVKRHDAMLKSRVKNHGPIDLGNEESLSFVSKSTRSPKEDALSTLHDLGFEDGKILEIMGLSVTGIDKLLKKRDDKEEVGERIFDEKESSVLKVVKGTEEA